MERFFLVERSGAYELSEDGVTRKLRPHSNFTIVVGPSLTFRKHFKVPGDIDRNPRSVYLEVFSNFLPGKPDEFEFQFVTHSPEQDDKVDVMGLAVKKEQLFNFRDHLSDPGEVYFFERILLDSSVPEQTLLEVPLPEGRFYAVFKQSLVWSRYLNAPDPDEEETAQTLHYVEEEYPTVKERQTLPPFRDSGAEAREWAQAFAGLLPESPNDELDLLKQSVGGLWRPHREKAWTLLIGLLVVLSAWLAVDLEAQRRSRRWIRTQYQNLFQSRSRYPVQELETQLARAEKLASASKKDILPKYPRLVSIDSAIGDRRLRMLRMTLVEQTGSVVFLAPSLGVAEGFLQALQQQQSVREAEIQSTDSTQQGDFDFEVKIRVVWQ